MSKDNQSNSEEEYDDQANEYNQLEDLFVFSPLFGFPDLGMSNLNPGLTSSVRARSANVAGGSALRPNSDPNLTLNPSSPKGMRANPEMEYLRRCLEFLSARMGRLEEAVFGMMELQDHSPQERHRHHSFPSSPLNEPPKMRELDEVCEAEFAQQPNPTNVDLNRMAQELLPRFPRIPAKVIVSAIRKWYRKKRDENGQKVFNACIQILQPMLNEAADLDAVQQQVHENAELKQRLLAAAELDITNEEAAIEFLDQKVDAYFKRRVLNNHNA